MRFISNWSLVWFTTCALIACGRVGFSTNADGGAPLVSADATFDADAGDLPLDAGSDAGGGGQDASGLSDGGPNDSGVDAGGVDAGSGDLGRAPGEVVLYLFDEGAGGQVRDRSQGGAPLDLNIVDATETRWVTGGLQLDGSTLINHAGAATKITDACLANDAFTVEAWVTPAQAITGGPARIATLSVDEQNRNFLLAQGDDNGSASGHYTFRYRTEDSNDNGRPALGTNADTATTALTHIVATYVPGTTRLYVDTAVFETTARVGSLGPWNRTYGFAIGNEHDGAKPWLGTLHLVAVYDRVLSPAEVQQNFDRGPDPELGM